MSTVVKMGRPAATGKYDSHEELRSKVLLGFALFPEATLKQIADLTGSTVSTVHKLKQI